MVGNWVASVPAQRLYEPISFLDPDLVVRKIGQLLRITLSAENGLNDLQTAEAGQV